MSESSSLCFKLGRISGRTWRAATQSATHVGFTLIVLLLGVVIFMVGVLPACGPAKPPFRLIAGSGFSTFVPILERFESEHGVDIQLTSKGSLDIMYLLGEKEFPYDAIWEGDSMWTSMGDTQKRIQSRESIMRSPIVFGVKKSVAERLGWTTPGKEISVQDILTAAEKENLRLMMTSATQSNSGASAYFGFLYAFAQPEGVLTSENLQDPQVQANVKKILGTIDRTSESSGWLRDLFPEQHAFYDGMFNYESHIIELNDKLAKKGLEPLYIVYPTPGLGLADFPLSYVDHDDADKKKIFDDLQNYLLSESVQKELMAKGRRVDLEGGLDPAVFKPEWGVDTQRILSSTKLPAQEVIWQALNLYQTKLRKPSFAVYVLDFSASMQGDGQRQLQAAMKTLLDQQEAGKYLLQTAPDDVTVVIPFDGRAREPMQVNGNSPTELDALLTQIRNAPLANSTNFYTPTANALRLIKAQGIGDRFPAIIVMTDGEVNAGSFQEVKQAIADTGLEGVPIYAITFGKARVDQLEPLTNLTHGRIFDGTKDLISAFRAVKGNY